MSEAITDQPDLVPLSRHEVMLLEWLIKDYERLLALIDGGRDPYGLRHAEKTGLSTAIAYLTGLHLIQTPRGGVEGWLPTLKYICALFTPDTLDLMARSGLTRDQAAQVKAQTPRR